MEPWREELAESHLNLVRKIAHQIFKSVPASASLEVDELVSYGTVALYSSVQKYDPKVGVKFSTYCWYRVRGAIYDGLKKSSDYKLIRGAQLKAQEAANEYLSAQTPSGAPAASSQSLLNTLSQGLQGVATAYMCAMDTTAPELADESVMPVEEAAALESSLGKLKPYVASLSEEERELLHKFYVEDISLADIAAAKGRSRSWGSRTHKKILDKLRDKLLKK